MTYSEIYETNARVRNITVTRIPCRLACDTRERCLKSFKHRYTIDRRVGRHELFVHRYINDNVFIRFFSTC